ncbi:uncharacterized protein LACBIDRAFT_311170 [Laccaria bicolor S238N-H82]|uniref:Predicted protein n=1 Tax=Laccaria bicolor (strain S238N-H82 / ATCC MYA-4686) TaxID=486041 RepID=B0CZD9_LACBS|nr:uncharacterized protein LACBIDRAFT_311170 [Laccaria bicolor S238N-H82]EDR12131.1 predicted protein [Laccaria bicolor S238N-H82]|eukprot:XP_001876395.1 predicted protein [Laccaria bicolor S238N-H82]
MGNRLHRSSESCPHTLCRVHSRCITTSLGYLFLNLFQTDPRRTRRGSCGRLASTSPKPRPSLHLQNLTSPLMESADEREVNDPEDNGKE